MKKYCYDFILLAVAMIWGSGFIAADIAVEHWPPIFITAMRFSIAALFFSIISIKKLKDIAVYLYPGFVIGFFLALGFIFQTVALNYTTPAKNAFLTSTNVIITPFLYFIFSRKAVTIKSLIGATLALVGIGILNFDGQSLLLSNKGDILTLICAFFFALHIYFTGYFLHEKNCNLNTIVLLQFLVAAIISWLATIFVEGLFLSNFNFISVPSYAVIYLGLFSTLLCFFLQNFAQRRVNPNKTAIILSLEALFGSLFSVLLRGEILTTTMLIGFSILFSAIMIIEVKIPKK